MNVTLGKAGDQRLDSFALRFCGSGERAESGAPVHWWHKILARQRSYPMPKNLSRVRMSASMDELYGAIHARMVERSGGQQGVRPTAAEFIEALERTSIGREAPILDAGCGGTLTFSIACADRGFPHVHAI